jgi:hypothetical protein
MKQIKLLLKMSKMTSINSDEANALVDELNSVMHKVKNFKLKIHRLEIPIIGEDHYLALVTVQKGSPSPENSIHEVV